MDKYLTYDFVNHLWKKTKKCSGYIFALATTVVTFVPFDNFLKSLNLNIIGIKLLFLVSLCMLSLIIAFFCVHYSENKGVVLFSKENASIKVEFGDMTKYITSNKGYKPYTVVIPINTHLNVVGNKKIIKHNSIHGFWIRQMIQCGYNESEIKNLVCEQIHTNAKEKCKIGDFCYIKNIENVNYLLIATCGVSNDKKSICTEQQYFWGLQAMVNALAKECDLQEEIYIPIIGGGYAYMEKTNQELLREMTEVLIFNNRKLQHEVHVIVYEKLKDEIPLFALRPQK